MYMCMVLLRVLALTKGPSSDTQISATEVFVEMNIGAAFARLLMSRCMLSMLSSTKNAKNVAIFLGAMKL